MTLHNPFDERAKALLETAEIVLAADGRISGRYLMEHLSDDSREYVGDLAHAPYESPADTLMDDARRNGIIEYDLTKRRYGIGKLGRRLIDDHLENMTDQICFCSFIKVRSSYIAPAKHY